MEYCKNCGRPITPKMWTWLHCDDNEELFSIYCFTNDRLNIENAHLVATPKTKEDKIREIINDL